MSDPLKQRLKLMLRAERAMGAPGVIAGDGAGDDAAIGATDAPPVESPSTIAAPANTAKQVAEAIGVSKPSLARGSENAAALFPTGDPPKQGVVLGPNRPPFDAEPLSRAQKLAQLTAMDEREVKGCTKCELCKTRTNTVFGEGDADAKLMFIGEGPGENEDLQGHPFVGRAGELLNKMIAGMGLLREQVFIANIVKCRPPNNRVPAPDEVSTCTPYLERQIELIRPQVIVTLGLPATQYMLQSKLTMGKLRGNWQQWRGIQLMPTYHPAYLLRNYTDSTRAAVWSDLQQVMKALGLARAHKT